MRSWIAAGIAALILALPVSAQAQKPETTKVRLAVGGKSSLYYLPLTVTERLGYFKEAGLAAGIPTLAGGQKCFRRRSAARPTGVPAASATPTRLKRRNRPSVPWGKPAASPAFAL